MRKAFRYIALSLILSLNVSLIYAAASLPPEKTKGTPNDAEKKMETDKEAFEKITATRKLLYEKMAKRTQDCKDGLDNMFLILNNFYRKAREEKDIKKEKELVAVMSDYNSVLGDVGLMQVILDLGKFADEERFLDYYIIMENGLERLKASFSLKNEIFLNRIDKELKTPDALRYEKKLSRIYREYFEYDPKIDNIEASKEAVSDKEKKLREKEK